ncbi:MULTISPECIES: hypothetical protein [unclassified Sphingobium]|uniref:hypothetical protein n=1 Tax=unclassified Sphingobium TaxID=2611147 RepID=UPI000D16B778|nr:MULTISPECIES: hypothetical protein [unclassified Sphingobium]PSO12613.1 hypothetical protein C7E20_05750 [Sphingobium sp. AEW4]TWD09791.1 hypothetical protein FB595_104138 [Sphingobium sp. AEW010]TWD26462.1 hypothetical protein FB596_104138 [Sphingobium sp. AEW013]TWD27769.1 hypothetical protein FB594_105190 [Sphingobium sp. AEW001]
MFKPTIAGPSSKLYRELEQSIRQKAEQALLQASHEAGRIASSRIKRAMSGAGLGRLGNAIDASSDLEKGGRVHRTGRGVSASSAIHLKTRSERTVGAIEAYTQGATIRPRNGSWLWIPSSELQRRVKGGKRVTPANWRTSGLEQRIGPLVKIPGKHAGEALLIVPAVTTRQEGRPSPRRLPKSGKARAGRVLRENFIAFTGIRSTSRQARIDPLQIIDGVRREMPALLAQALEK